MLTSQNWRGSQLKPSWVLAWVSRLLNKKGEDPAPQASCHGSVLLRLSLIPAPSSLSWGGGGAGEAGCGTASTLIIVSRGELVSAPGPRGSGGKARCPGGLRGRSVLAWPLGSPKPEGSRRRGSHLPAAGRPGGGST